jgi:hypothetical protein
MASTSTARRLAVADELPVPDSLLEVELAIKRREVSFPMVMRALALAPERLYRPALEVFADTNGGIRESFYADEFPAGALLTGRDDLFFDVWWDRLDFDTTPARELECDISDLRLRAMLYLDRGQRRIFMQRLLRLYKGLISSLRSEWMRPRSDESTLLRDLDQLRNELARVHAAYRQAACARGAATYVAAAAAGAAMITVVVGVLALIVDAVDHTIWLGTLAAGAAGGLLSVLERSNRGALRVSFEADRTWLGGIYRPTVGALSGLAVFALVGGGLVPVEVPADATDRGLFFAALGFLAGFVERFAKDVFGSAAGAIPGAPAASSTD